MSTTITPELAPDVAIEIANGDEIGTVQLARERNLSPNCIFRWLTRGLPAAGGSRVRLAGVKRGKTWLTSRAAVRRFFAALPNNTTANAPAPRSPKSPTTRSADKRQRDREAATAELRRRGI